ncbi:MAG: DinB family protein, partial [Acidobacteriota bacterium]|nr:DinB family protein [Acidobacteriota bacterium]
MRRTKWLLAPALVLACAAAQAQTAKPAAQVQTPGRSLEPLFRVVEKNLVGVADAMPADKYQFAPT